MFFNIDKVADLTSQLDHMLPTAEYFAGAVGQMGVSNNTLVLIYDDNHFFAAARVWWMFRVFGHDLVRIIDGGMARWRQLNFSINSYQSNQVAKTFRATFHPELVFDLEQMRVVQKNKSWQIIDARSANSFWGLRKCVTETLQQSHIPNSINIPYAGLTDSERQTLGNSQQITHRSSVSFCLPSALRLRLHSLLCALRRNTKDKQKSCAIPVGYLLRVTLLTNQSLQLLFDAAHIDVSKPIVTTCGSGISAAVLALALYQLGLHDIPVYDGSWAEWENSEIASVLIPSNAEYFRS